MIDLQSALARHEIPLRLGFAGEVRLTDQLMQQVADNEIPFLGEIDGFRKFEQLLPHYLFGFRFLQQQRMRWLAGPIAGFQGTAALGPGSYAGSVRSAVRTFARPVRAGGC